MKVTKNCTPKIPKYSCESCDYTTSKKSNYDKHLQTEKHFEKMSGYKVAEQLPEVAKYFCKSCDYTTKRKHDYDKHCETLKCKSVTKSSKLAKLAQNSQHISINMDEHTSCVPTETIDMNCDESVTEAEKSPKIPKNPLKILMKTVTMYHVLSHWI